MKQQAIVFWQIAFRTLCNGGHLRADAQPVSQILRVGNRRGEAHEAHVLGRVRRDVPHAGYNDLQDGPSAPHISAHPSAIAAAHTCRCRYAHTMSKDSAHIAESSALGVSLSATMHQNHCIPHAIYLVMS